MGTRTEDTELITNGSFGQLQAHRNTLALKRDRLQKLYNAMAPMAWFLPIVGVPFAWFIYKTYANTVFWILPLMYCFAPLAIAPSYRQRISQLEYDIQELDFRIDLQQFEVNKRQTQAEKLLRVNDFQLRRYYDLNISQNSWIFLLGIFCIVLGIAMVGITLFLVIRVAHSLQTQVITAALGSIGAILANFVAVIYLKMNSTATDNLKVFHSRLVETHQFLLGNLLASRIEQDEKRWETLSRLSLCLMQKGRDYI